MNRVLNVLAQIATRFPSLTLAALIAMTVGLGALAPQLNVDTGVEGFAPEGGLADTQRDISDRFAAGSAVQILLDAGAGGNVLSAATITATDAFATTLEADPTVAAALQEEQTGRPPIVSFAYPFTVGFDDEDDAFADLSPGIAALVIDTVVDEAADDIAPMLSSDFSRAERRARSGLMQVSLDGEAPSEVRRAAAAQIGDLVANAQLDGIRTGVLSTVAIESAIEDSLARDLPRLLAASFALVLLVLALLFRSFADVAVGFVGLLASIVWMFGFAVLLGPAYAGVVGDFNQIGIAIPVLLVGLGIDYSVHLTTRYREQRARGDEAHIAAQTAVQTVGFALILATIASVAGFLANIATPLPPIRDFGILAASGIVAAFVILGAAVPATRTLIDRRRPAEHDRTPAALRTNSRDSWWVRLATTAATRAAFPVLGVTAAILAVGGYLATGLSTEFDDRDFLPEGSPLTLLIDRLDARFGGDVGERTFVLVDGDVTDATFVGAVAEYEAGLTDVAAVRRIGTRPDVISPFFFVEMYAEQGERARERIADDFDRWLDPERAAADTRLPATFDQDQIDDDDLDLPDDLSVALTRRLGPGQTMIGALLNTMDRAELESTIRDALADEYRSDRPTHLDDETLAHLASLPAKALRADVLRDARHFSTLSQATQDALRIIDALEDAGWAGDRTEAGEQSSGFIGAIANDARDELATVIDRHGILLNVATAAGQDAHALAEELSSRTADIRTAGGTVTIVSDQLIQAEIIDSLAAAQLQAIVISLIAAAVLLIAATLYTSRSVGLGLIGIVPSGVALILVLAIMRLAGIPFNALTATVASIAVGIGVPYGIHLINRFREARAHGLDPEAAIRDTLRNTGPALIGSGVTTGLAFIVLIASESTPVMQFGRVSSMMIACALLACLFVQPALLVLWARRRDAIGR